MTLKFDQFAAATKASVDTVFGLSAQAFESVEKLIALNLQTIKTVLTEFQETCQVALLAKNPADLLKLQTEALQAAPQKAVPYGRQLQAIFVPIAAAQRATFDAQIADVQAKFLDAVNGAMKDAPGAEKFLSLAKSAVAAANHAYDGANTAAKQVSDAVTASVTKVTETTLKTSQGALATIEA
jgi:phasin family protein